MAAVVIHAPLSNLPSNSRVCIGIYLRKDVEKGVYTPPDLEVERSPIRLLSATQGLCELHVVWAHYPLIKEHTLNNL